MHDVRGRAARPVRSLAVIAVLLAATAMPAPSASPRDALAFTPPVALPAPGSARETSVAIGPDGLAHAVTLGSGSQRFVSADRGRSYRWTSTMATAAMGGGRDADVAIAPEPNGSGHHTVFTLDLWRSSVNLEISKDGGRTWASHPLTALIPGLFAADFASTAHERPWVVADGSSTAWVSYTSVGHFVVRCEAEPVVSCGAPMQALDLSPFGPPFPHFPGGFELDRARGRLYQAYLATGPKGPVSQVWMAASADGGKTWRQSRVHEDPEGDNLVQFFPIPAVDGEGNVYVTWSDGGGIWLAVSTDGAATWSDAIRINQEPSTVGVEPWVAAGSEGIVDIVWYGADSRSGTWYPYFAQVRGLVNEGVVGRAPAIEQVALTDEPVWVGEIGRGLLDFFEVAIDPADGAALTAYSEGFGRRSFSLRQCAGGSAIAGRTVAFCDAES